MIIGHQKIKNQLDKAVRNGQLSHAYLFSGPRHLGKFSLALELAEKLTGRKAEINPDIVIASGEINKEGDASKKSNIKVEDIRELGRKLYMTTYAGKNEGGYH